MNVVDRAVTKLRERATSMSGMMSCRYTHLVRGVRFSFSTNGATASFVFGCDCESDFLELQSDGLNFLIQAYEMRDCVSDACVGYRGAKTFEVIIACHHDIIVFELCQKVIHKLESFQN